MILVTREVPPWLKKGKLTPLLGNNPDTTPKFKNACSEIRKVIAIAR